MIFFSRLYQGLEWITSKLKGRWPLVWHKVKYQGSRVHQTLEEEFKSFGSVLICFVFPDYSAPSPKYLTQTQSKFSGTVATMFYLLEQILKQWIFFYWSEISYDFDMGMPTFIWYFEVNIFYSWHFLGEKKLVVRERQKGVKFLVFRKKCFYFQIESDVLDWEYC